MCWPHPPRPRVCQAVHNTSALDPKQGQHKLDIEVYNGACEHVAVKAVQQATMAWNELAGVLHAGIALHDRLQQVPKQASHEDGDAHATGNEGAQGPMESTPEAQGDCDTPYQAPQGALHSLLGADGDELCAPKPLSREVGAGVRSDDAGHGHEGGNEPHCPVRQASKGDLAQADRAVKFCLREGVRKVVGPKQDGVAWPAAV